jgi:hypothetical protein
VKGSISYNGYKLDEFIPQKTSVYISQNDLHVGEMTVRETLDFSARCQGIGTRYGEWVNLSFCCLRIEQSKLAQSWVYENILLESAYGLADSGF